ncbi:MAG: ImmA/IrrE family metallo-endopeptidase [Enterococcaceae bacterium]|jgi:hypothetical protein|nr:ImmA/IrrE family metallo-endopeptidase [Enterococcaceae bacterium]
MGEMKALLEKYGIILQLVPINKPGYYLTEYKTIFISDQLDDLSQIKVILHEAGHGILHDDLQSLYLLDGFHAKMEYQAERFMLSELLKIYVSMTGMDIQDFDFMKFIEQNGLDPNYQDVIKELAHTYTIVKNVKHI